MKRESEVPYSVWSWVLITLLAIGVIGLIATIPATISRALRPPVLLGFRLGLLALGIVSAISYGSLSIGLFPLGYPDHAESSAGIARTGDSGIITQHSSGAEEKENHP